MSDRIVFDTTPYEEQAKADPQQAWMWMRLFADAFEVPLLMCAGERDVLDRQAAADREWFDEHVRPLDTKTPPRL